ncbi:MAG TPA: DNA-binding protein [Pseudolabrys sp.]|nr:DNA-binding protein [Pseudolabrys sp.]
MTEEEVRKAVEELLAKGEKPSVRKVRTALGERGSHTDLSAILRKVLEQRDRLNTARSEMPQEVRDRLDLLAADFWQAAQQKANQAVEDAERGAATRVATAEDQTREMAEHADLLEATVKETDKLISLLKQSEEKANKRAKDAESKAATLQAKLRVANENSKKRDAEFDELYRRLDTVLKKAS